MDITHQELNEEDLKSVMSRMKSTIIMKDYENDEIKDHISENITVTLTEKEKEAVTNNIFNNYEKTKEIYNKFIKKLNEINIKTFKEFLKKFNFYDAKKILDLLDEVDNEENINMKLNEYDITDVIEKLMISKIKRLGKELHNSRYSFIKLIQKPETYIPIFIKLQNEYNDIIYIGKLLDDQFDDDKLSELNKLFEIINNYNIYITKYNKLLNYVDELNKEYFVKILNKLPILYAFEMLNTFTYDESQKKKLNNVLINFRNGTVDIAKIIVFFKSLKHMRRHAGGFSRQYISKKQISKKRTMKKRISKKQISKKQISKKRISKKRSMKKQIMKKQSNR